MRTRFGVALLILVAAAVGALPVVAVCVPTVFAPDDYYVIPVGEIEIATAASIESAKQRDYAIVIQEAEGPATWRGATRTEEEESLFLQEPALMYVDGESLLVRVQTASYGFVLRPSEEGYELVVTPSETVEAGNTLVEILLELSEIGIAPGSISLSDAVQYSVTDLKGPPPPEGAALESSLYQLVIAADWFATASASGIQRTGLRVSVIAERVIGEAIPESYRVFVVEETEQLAELLLPIQHLVPLARSASVTYVRMPYQPIVPAPSS